MVYLVDQEYRAEILSEKDNYAFCRMLVSKLLEGFRDPYVAAFYYTYGRHPNKLIPEFLWQAEKDRRLNIPDYDPLSDPLSKIRSFPSRPGPMYQMPVLSWPGQQDSLRNPPQEEYFGQPEIPRSIPEAVTRPDSRELNWCTECGVPVCERSTRLCAQHLLRARERHKWFRERRRRMNMCAKCPNPICEDSTDLCARHLLCAREAANRRYVRKQLAMGRTVKHRKGQLDRWMQESIDNLISAGFCGS
jgi:hypothetical protein